MLEFNFPEPVRLLLPLPPDADGATRFRAVAARAWIRDSSSRAPESGGIRENARVFLLRSPEPPLPGARIRHRGRDYDLRSVRVCQDLDGRTVTYLCTAV